MPKAITSTEKKAFARQLLRFQNTGHPYTALIDQPDIDQSQALQPTFDTNEQPALHEDLYPQEWLNKRSFVAFLGRWRTTDKGKRPANPAPTKATGSANLTKAKPSTTAGSSQSTKPQSPRVNSLGIRQNFPTAGPLRQSLIGSRARRQSEPWTEPSFDVDDDDLSRRTDLEDTLAKLTVRPDLLDIPPSTGNTPPRVTPDRSLTDSIERPRNGETPERQQNNNMAGNLTAEDIANIVARTVQAMQPVNPQPPQPVQVTLAQPVGGLKAQDIGYFDPKPRDQGPGVVADGKVTKYTDVYAFCDRLNHLATARSEDEVKAVWTQCLLGNALVWHSHVLSDVDRQMLQGVPLNLVIEKLKDRFRTDYSDAMNWIKASHFRLLDVAQDKDILVFVQTAIRNAKACNFDVQGQLVAAFEALDGDIQSELKKPNANTTLEDFLNDIRDRESVLRRRAAQRFPITADRRLQPPPAVAGKTFNAPSNRPQFQGQANRPQQNFRQPQGYGQTQGYRQPFPRGGFNPQWQPRYQSQNRPFGQPNNQGQYTNPYQQTYNPYYGRGCQYGYNSQYRQGNQPPQNQQNQQRQAQQQGGLVPENRRLPAPPPRFGQPGSRPTGQPAYHGTDEAEQATTPKPASMEEPSGYRTPSVEDVPEQDQTLQSTATLDSYDGMTPFPDLEYPVSQDWFETDETSDPAPEEVANFAAIETITEACRHCGDVFDSHNKLMEHVYRTHLNKPWPGRTKGRGRNVSRAGTPDLSQGEAFLATQPEPKN
jgi:hypothetical protein